MNMESKKHYAFISYSHHDVKMAKWLHKKLESYKLPIEIHNEFEDSRYLRPIFRDQEDLNTGILNDELRRNLENSKYLIVICSHHSAKSEWVSNEVRSFIEMGRLEYIIPVIIEESSIDDNYRESLPRSLRDFISYNPSCELLGVSLTEVGREKAFVRIVSRMLGVDFDELWKRHEKERIRRILTTLISCIMILTSFYYLAIPISLTIVLHDEIHRLPSPDNPTLIVNKAEYHLYSLDTTLVITSIPGYYRGRKLPIAFSERWYVPVNVNARLGWGIRSRYNIFLHRDSYFSCFAGHVIDQQGMPVRDAKVSIENQVCFTDNNGHFFISFPVKKQSETKEIHIIKDGYKDYYRKDECPDTNLIYTMKK